MKTPDFIKIVPPSEGEMATHAHMDEVPCEQWPELLDWLHRLDVPDYLVLHWGDNRYFLENLSVRLGFVTGIDAMLRRLRPDIEVRGY